MIDRQRTVVEDNNQSLVLAFTLSQSQSTTASKY